MNTDQYLRVAGIVAVLVGYVARLVTVGNGPIEILGYGMAPIGLLTVAVLLLAAPETIDRLPFGPSK